MNQLNPISQSSQGTINIENYAQPQQKQQRYKSFKKLLLIVANYALGNFYFGYCMVYLNTIQFTAVMIIYGIKVDQDLALGLLTGCIPIGAGIGALSSNYLLNNYSRKQSLLIVNAIALIVGSLIFIQNFIVLLIIRLIQGLCVGAYSVLVPILIKQTTPVEVSGKLGVVTQFFIALGIFFAFFFKFILSKMTGDQFGQYIWIYIFGFTLLTISLQTVVVFFIYNFQTPKYLIEKQQFLEAKQLLSLVYKAQYVEQVYREKLQDAQKLPKTSKDQISFEVLDPENKSIIQQNKIVDSIEIVEDNTPRRAIFLAIHLGLFQQFTGINAVVVYGGQTVGEVYPSLKSIFPMILSLIQVVSPLILSTILACVGRKPIMQVGTFFNIITTAIVGTGFFLINSQFKVAAGMILAGLVLFMINFALTIGPLVWLYVPQIVQPKIVTIATFFNWLGATLIMFLFPIIKGKMLKNNPSLLFYFFTVWSVMSLLINQKFIIQTKDKTQKQIRDEFKKPFRDSSTQQSNSEETS